MKIIIREPSTPEELENYHFLRWQLLRQPWQQPRGSELDEHENSAKKVMAIYQAEIIGVGRLHQVSDRTWQIRYMAVQEAYQGQNIGSMILHKLEDLAQADSAKKIILQARQNAVPFYQKHGYQIYQAGETLFGKIPHFWLQKIL